MCYMVVYLGPEVLGKDFYSIVTEIIQFCNNEDANIRLHTSYMIGIIAEKVGNHFENISYECI